MNTTEIQRMQKELAELRNCLGLFLGEYSDYARQVQADAKAHDKLLVAAGDLRRLEGMARRMSEKLLSKEAADAGA